MVATESTSTGTPTPPTKAISGGVLGAIGVIGFFLLNYFVIKDKSKAIPADVATAITVVVSFWGSKLYSKIHDKIFG
jgi:hypothetical protein